MSIKETLLVYAARFDPLDPKVADQLRVVAENPKDCDAKEFVRLYLEISNNPLSCFSTILL